MDVGVVAHATGSAYVEFNHTKVRDRLLLQRQVFLSPEIVKRRNNYLSASVRVKHARNNCNTAAMEVAPPFLEGSAPS